MSGPQTPLFGPPDSQLLSSLKPEAEDGGDFGPASCASFFPFRVGGSLHTLRAFVRFVPVFLWCLRPRHSWPGDCATLASTNNGIDDQARNNEWQQERNPLQQDATWRYPTLRPHESEGDRDQAYEQAQRHRYGAANDDSDVEGCRNRRTGWSRSRSPDVLRASPPRTCPPKKAFS